MVISDTDALYLYGLDIIAEQLAQSDRYYYMHDGLGSVRQLLDNTGQIAETYAHDPFGMPLVGNGVANPFRFTGEAWDAGVELLYLRARYYQPSTGRFVTRDPWPGDVWRPGTLNRYVYVTNNPVNMVDPTGLQCVGPDCGPQASGPPTPETSPPGAPPGPVAIGTPVPPGAAPSGTAGPTPPPEPSRRPIPAPAGTPRPCDVPAPRLAPQPMPFEEWKARFPPDPYRGLPPVPRLRFMSDAMMVYFKKAPTAGSAARSGRNNPLLRQDLPGEVGVLAVRNGNSVPFVFPFLITELKMDVARITNFEPYFLTLLKNHHPKPLEDAQRAAYDFMKERGWNEKFSGKVFEALYDYFPIGIPPVPSVQ